MPEITPNPSDPVTTAVEILDHIEEKIKNGHPATPNDIEWLIASHRASILVVKSLQAVLHELSNGK